MHTQDTSPSIFDLDFVGVVKKTMDYSGQTTGKFNPQQIGLYIGLMLEEAAEAVTTVSEGVVDSFESLELRNCAVFIATLGERFKENCFYGAILRSDRAKLLDDMVDTAVVSIGAIHSTSHSAYSAVAEVCRANLDKYPGGVGTRDENGKWVKPAGWRAPDLSAFVEPAQD